MKNYSQHTTTHIHKKRPTIGHSIEREKEEKTAHRKKWEKEKLCKRKSTKWERNDCCFCQQRRRIADNLPHIGFVVALIILIPFEMKWHGSVGTAFIFFRHFLCACFFHFDFVHCIWAGCGAFYVSPPLPHFSRAFSLLFVCSRVLSSLLVPSHESFPSEQTIYLLHYQMQEIHALHMHWNVFVFGRLEMDDERLLSHTLLLHV